MVGKDGVTSVTIAIYAYSLFTAIFMGYSMGTSPIISFNYGRNNKDYLKNIYRYSKQIIFTAGFLTYPVRNAFIPVTGFHLYAAGFIPLWHGYPWFSPLFDLYCVYGIQYFTAPPCLQRIPTAEFQAIISVMRTPVFIVAALLLLPLIFDGNGVWIAMPVAEFLGLLVTFSFFSGKIKSDTIMLKY